MYIAVKKSFEVDQFRHGHIPQEYGQMDGLLVAVLTDFYCNSMF